MNYLEDNYNDYQIYFLKQLDKPKQDVSLFDESSDESLTDEKENASVNDAGILILLIEKNRQNFDFLLQLREDFYDHESLVFVQEYEK